MYVKIILILIYTGLRISTLLDLKKEDVHLDENYLFIIKDKDTRPKEERDTSKKTSSRNVPICEQIKPLIIEWLNYSNIEYLLCTPEQEHFTYRNYYDSYFKKVLSNLGLSHRPHDCRHTCATLLKRANVRDHIIKEILGHEKQDLTDKVYVHIRVNEMVEAINLIHDVR